MAEVFRGESLSVQGFKKQVAIKRVLPHLAQNKSFISMFLDEARLGARLSHANIVTVFDIGAADETFFIVMEFIDGCNLKAVMEHFRQMGRRLGVKESVYICMETCRGLSYAHELVGDEGEPLHLVHRDISPPNILLSKRGEIKVTDFGLAKATTQLEKTDPGVVKGKFSYLSPEAANGQGLDGRADIFALGIVLWEMLAGRRLFLGESDYQTVKLVQQANVPSLSRLNPEVDKDLEAVLMKALTQDPRDRYENARDFGDALAGYLFGKQLKVTAYDIANIVKEVVDKKKSARVAQDASIIDRLIQEELLRFTSLDDMSPGTDAITIGDAPPLSPESSAGAMPLDAALFENPADWFANDPDIGDAVEVAAGPSSGANWIERGLENEPSDLASLLESDADLDAAPPPRISFPDARVSYPEARISYPDADARISRPTPAPPERTSVPNPIPNPPLPNPPQARPRVELPDPEPMPLPQRGGGAAKWVVLVTLLLLIGAGAAAYFGGYIPL